MLIDQFPAPGQAIEFRSRRLGKTLRLRLPSDDEYMALERRRKRAETSEERTKQAAELLETLLVEPLPSLNGDEAEYALQQLLKAQPRPADEATFEAGILTLRLGVFGGLETLHRFRMPRRADERDYSDVFLQNLSSGALRIREASRFYDSAIDSSEPYQDAPPIWHKAMAADMLLAQLGRLDDDAEVCFFSAAAPDEAGATASATSATGAAPAAGAAGGGSPTGS